MKGKFGDSKMVTLYYQSIDFPNTSFDPTGITEHTVRFEQAAFYSH